MRGKYRMRSCSSRNLLDSVGNVNLPQKRHIGRISIFAAGDNTFNCFYPELDLWDGTSSQDAKNKSISPQPGRHRARWSTPSPQSAAPNTIIQTEGITGGSVSRRLARALPISGILGVFKWGRQGAIRWARGRWNATRIKEQRWRPPSNKRDIRESA